MRGDKFHGPVNGQLCQGSPPHARGQVMEDVLGVAKQRITPACAGTRRTGWCNRIQGRDHPRMRGDKLLYLWAKIFCQGSPPHARGQGKHPARVFCAAGITPACAGTSARMLPVRCLRRGSPPHARGQVAFGNTAGFRFGITPACAGTRTVYPRAASQAWDHPRMRGDKQLPAEHYLFW